MASEDACKWHSGFISLLVKSLLTNTRVIYTFSSFPFTVFLSSLDYYIVPQLLSLLPLLSRNYSNILQQQ